MMDSDRKLVARMHRSRTCGNMELALTRFPELYRDGGRNGRGPGLPFRRVSALHYSSACITVISSNLLTRRFCGISRTHPRETPVGQMVAGVPRAIRDPFFKPFRVLHKLVKSIS